MNQQFHMIYNCHLCLYRCRIMHGNLSRTIFTRVIFVSDTQYDKMRTITEQMNIHDSQFHELLQGCIYIPCPY